MPQSQPLSYQAVTTTATGKPLFSATFGSIATGSTVQALNVFNPANSGVSYTFHSARLYTNDNTGLAQGNLILLSGADLNLGTAVSAVSHDGNANPRVSTAHVTAEDIGSAHGGTVIETIDAQTAVINDFLAFPDNYTLAPGNNLRITCVSGNGTTGHVVRLTIKWSEDVQLPPTLAAGGGQSAVATLLKNLANAIGTVIAQASPSGDPGIAVFLTNDGQLALGDATNHGKLTVGPAPSLLVNPDDGSGNDVTLSSNGHQSGRLTKNHLTSPTSLNSPNKNYYLSKLVIKCTKYFAH